MGNSATKTFASRTGFPTNLVFRNVEEVLFDKNAVSFIQVLADENGIAHYDVPISEEEMERLSDDEKNRTIMGVCPQFSGWTTSTILLPDTDLVNLNATCCIRFSSENMVDINPETFKLEPFHPLFPKVIPREGRAGTGTEPDIVAGVIAHDPERDDFYFSQWFICSRQFYHAYILLKFPTHPSIPLFWFGKKMKHDDDFEEKLKKKALALNNKLGTNPPLWLRSAICIHKCKDGSEIKAGSTAWHSFPLEERKMKVWAIRSEAIARTWSHIYIALVAILRWGIIPSDENVPRSLTPAPSKNKTMMIHQSMYWIIHPNFVDSVLKLSNA